MVFFNAGKYLKLFSYLSISPEWRFYSGQMPFECLHVGCSLLKFPAFYEQLEDWLWEMSFKKICASECPSYLSMQPLALQTVSWRNLLSSTILGNQAPWQCSELHVNWLSKADGLNMTLGSNSLWYASKGEMWYRENLNCYLFWLTGQKTKSSYFNTESLIQALT